MQTARFFARGTAMVQDIDAMYAGRRQYVGRRLDPTKGEKFVDPEDGKTMRQQAVFAPTKEPSEVRLHPEYIKAVADGDLWPADEKTAQLCGVKFDSSFGGEKLAIEGGVAGETTTTTMGDE